MKRKKYNARKKNIGTLETIGRKVNFFTHEWIKINAELQSPHDHYGNAHYLKAVGLDD